MGAVIDSTGVPLIGANASVYKLPDSIKTTEITDEKGRFAFRGLPSGDYYLKVNFIGYQHFGRRITIEEDRPTMMGRIILKETILSTGTVNIETKLPAVTQKGDTVQYNAKAYKTNPDATTNDLVQKMPGISMQNGRLQAQGEEVKKVTVDGKPFFGDDPNATLRNLPADIVDKVQVFDQKSDQARFTGFNDGQTNKTINIVTKAGAKYARFGKFSAGAGTNERYTSSAMLNLFKGAQRITLTAQSNNTNEQNFDIADISGSAFGRGGGGGRGPFNNSSVFSQSGITTTNAAGINFSDDWGKYTKFSGSYFFNKNNNRVSNNINRQYFLSGVGDSVQTYREDNSTTSQNLNHRVNMFIQYDPDTNNSFEFRPGLTLQQNVGASPLIGNTKRGKDTISSTNSLSGSNVSAYNFNGNLMYRHRLKKRGRTFSITANGGISSNKTTNYLFSDNNFINGTFFNLDSLNQKGNQNQINQNLTLGLTYTEPLGKFGQLFATYTPAVTYTLNDKTTFNNYFEQSIAVDSLNKKLSSKFDSRYLTQAGGAGYTYNKEKVTITLRANYQYSELKNITQYPDKDSITRTFNNILPLLWIQYRPSKDQSFRMVYRTSVDAPSVTQLQRLVNNTNPLQLSTGNPDLKQTYTHWLWGRYNKSNIESGSSWGFNYQASAQQDYVGRSTSIAVKDTSVNGVSVRRGAQLSSPVNLSGYASAGITLDYGTPIKALKSNLNLSGRLNYNVTPGLINNQRNDAHTVSYGSTLTLSSNISENLDFTLSSTPSINRVVNTLQKDLNTNYYQFNSSARINWVFLGGWVFNTTATHTFNRGLSAGFNQNYLLLNASFGRKFLKNNSGDIRLSVFDALLQNNSISRTTTDSYIQDTRTLVLQRYFMLTFTYTLRAFNMPAGAERSGQQGPGGPDSPQRRERMREMMMR
jgi:hypothetical protein